MKKFALRLAVFATPFLLYLGLVWLVDPFNYYRPSSIVDPELKVDTAYRLDPHLWKAIEFRREAAPNLILGDSRATHLQAGEVSEVAGEAYYNFAYGGGRLSEMIDTFWLASSRTELRNVYFCINFNRYNGTETMNLVPQSIKASSSLLNYSFGRQTFGLTFRLLWSHMRGDRFEIGTPDLTKEDFWETQLHKSEREYRNYQHPKDHLASLTEIAEYCRQHGIGLHFLILPTHVDLQAKIDEFELRKEESVFKSDLSKLGRVVDFDYPNEFTSDGAKFSDPYHFKGDGGVIAEIWGGKPKWGKVIEKE